MPSIRVSATDPQFARIISALDRRMEREPEDETDGQFYKRWLKGIHVELVFGAERQAAQGTVMADPSIATVEDA